MMKQMGGLKIASKVTAISAEPIAADAFAVPQGYRIVKQ